MIVDRLFKLSISLAVLAIVAGIVAAPLTGSKKSFEFAPVLSAVRATWNWITQSAVESTQPEAEPSPFVEELQDTTEQVKDAIEQSNLSAIQNDPRLSICPTGSIDGAKVREIPLTLAEEARKVQFQTLTEVQALLGEPACNITEGQQRQWRYLIAGGRIADFVQQGEALGITATYTNF